MFTLRGKLWSHLVSRLYCLSYSAVSRAVSELWTSIRLFEFCFINFLFHLSQYDSGKNSKTSSIEPAKDKTSVFFDVSSSSSYASRIFGKPSKYFTITLFFFGVERASNCGKIVDNFVKISSVSSIFFFPTFTNLAGFAAIYFLLCLLVIS